MPRGPPAPAREAVRTPHKLKIYVYEFPAWLNMMSEVDFYAGHERHDSIYSAYNLFYERLLQDWRAAPGTATPKALPPRFPRPARGADTPDAQARRG